MTWLKDLCTGIYPLLIMSQSNKKKAENTGSFSKAKKRKTEEENQRFQDKLKLLYVVTPVKENV